MWSINWIHLSTSVKPQYWGITEFTFSVQTKCASKLSWSHCRGSQMFALFKNTLALKRGVMMTISQGFSLKYLYRWPLILLFFIFATISFYRLLYYIYFHGKFTSSSNNWLINIPYIKECIPKEKDFFFFLNAFVVIVVGNKFQSAQRET